MAGPQYVKSQFNDAPYETEAQMNEAGMQLIHELIPALQEDPDTAEALRGILHDYFSIPGWYCHAGYITSVVREANHDARTGTLDPEDITGRILDRNYTHKTRRPDEAEKRFIRTLHLEYEYSIRRIAGRFQRSTETVQRIIKATPQSCSAEEETEECLNPADTRPQGKGIPYCGPAKQTPVAASLP